MDNSAKNLNKESQEAFRALINSIAPETTHMTENMTPETINRLSEKLNELIDTETLQNFNQGRNERGELINEEGLPIIDISETLEMSEDRGLGSVLADDPLIHLSTLPTPVKQRLRQQRDRILDELEEEERLEGLSEKITESRQREEMVRKRNEELAKESERLKTAKELQKKMGKALLRTDSKEIQEKNPKSELSNSQDVENQLNRPPALKKSVTFADAPSIDKGEEEQKPDSFGPLEFGDVALGKLRSGSKPTLLSNTRLSNDHLPMRMNVIERMPAIHPGVPTSPIYDRDSDDESDDNETAFSQPDGPIESEEELQEDALIEEEDIEFDFAREQREIALEYHKKRHGLGATVAEAISHARNQETAEEPRIDGFIPNIPRPSISHFKADRLASAYQASTPFTSGATEASILPASSARTLQRSIRLGELDVDNHLVGGENDSASEEENESIQEILQLLKKGEAYNIGPDGQFVNSFPSRPNAQKESVGAADLTSTSSPDKKPTSLPPLSRPKTSKFKASREAAGRPTQSRSTPEPLSSTSSTSTNQTSSSRMLLPSLAPPAATHSIVISSTPHAIDPSSFRQPQSSSASITPSPYSTIVESPSFPPPSHLERAKSSPSAIPSPVSRSTSNRLDKPPIVMSSAVREAIHPPRSGEVLSQSMKKERTDKKVSKFLLERM